MYQLNEKRVIGLPRGGQLEVEMSREFVHLVSRQFGLSPNELTDDHVRMFVWGSLKNAIDKAEDGADGEGPRQPA